MTDVETILRANPTLDAILDRADQLGLPDWYVGAGCIAQTVWNHLHGFDPRHGIKDYDVVYFDRSDLSKTSELAVEGRANQLLADLDAELDVKNEARVHVWFTERFGVAMEPYESCEHAISTWPTTASSIGIRPYGDGLTVCAPFGWDDVFDLVVRPNKALVTQVVYEAKAQRWASRWPKLTVRPW